MRTKSRRRKDRRGELRGWGDSTNWSFEILTFARIIMCRRAWYLCSRPKDDGWRRVQDIELGTMVRTGAADGPIYLKLFVGKMDMKIKDKIDSWRHIRADLLFHGFRQVYRFCRQSPEWLRWRWRCDDMERQKSKETQCIMSSLRTKKLTRVTLSERISLTEKLFMYVKVFDQIWYIMRSRESWSVTWIVKYYANRIAKRRRSSIRTTFDRISQVLVSRWDVRKITPTANNCYILSVESQRRPIFLRVLQDEDDLLLKRERTEITQ